MDLNHIILPPSVVSTLYQYDLIDSNETLIDKGHIIREKNQQKSIAISKYASVGDNLKNILVVVKNPGIDFLPKEDLQFLTGILAACKLTLADVAIVNIAEDPLATYKGLTSFFKSRIVFLFSISPVEFGLPMDFPFYQIQSFAGNSFMHAPSLEALAKDKAEKTQLWVSLKRLFNL